MRSRAAVCLALPAVLGACNLLFSMDDYAGPSHASCKSCAAESCQCVAKAPAGLAYARLHVNATIADLCPIGMLAGVWMGQGARDTGCNCGCDSPASGAPCALAIYSGKGCVGLPSQTIGSSSCTALGVTTGSAAVIPAPGTSCSVVAKVNDPDFGVRVRACLDESPVQSGCDSATICAAAPGSPFDDSPCIAGKPGQDVSCPSDYSHRYVFATGFVDQRKCDPAGCSCAAQECPTTKVTLCQDTACSSNCLLSATPFTNCKDFGGGTHGRVDSDGKTEGLCTPSGQSATLTNTKVTATGSLVVCCRNTLQE